MVDIIQIWLYNTIWGGYSYVWFNTPRLAAADRKQSIRAFGIKPDGIINFLTNEAPVKPCNAYRYPALQGGEPH
jgi:hypothetical protein